jgi:stage IV sporulation protein A
MGDFVNNIYTSIEKRTNGDIYVGVVGPVRTGKSTFIKKFMDLMVIPNIKNDFAKERAKDELPQSANGRTIMTTEPKFIPNEAVEMVLEDQLTLKVRFVDCVGYLVKGAIGHIENEEPRLVHTPWFENQIPFIEAAEIGTRKVIAEHSTIGMVVTCDGSFSEINREDYIEAEERVIRELKELHKPFVVLLNSSRPKDAETALLREELEKKYEVPVLCINCAFLKKEDIHDIFDKLLYEFPIGEVAFSFPGWIAGLDMGHELKKNIYHSLKETFKNASRIRDVGEVLGRLEEKDFVKKVYIQKMDLGIGKVSMDVSIKENLFYGIMTQMSGMEIKSEKMLFSIVKEFSEVKQKYEKIKKALLEVEETGYGIVMPQMEELSLEEPQILKQGGKYGVRLRASAPSIHLIKAEIETEIAPLVGSEKQSEELLNYLMKEFETDPSKIWTSNIFGKSLHELVNEGLNNKLGKMPADARLKLKETLQRIVNEGSAGLICIIL